MGCPTRYVPRRRGPGLRPSRLPTPPRPGPSAPRSPSSLFPREGPASPSVTDSSPGTTSPPPPHSQFGPSVSDPISAFCLLPLTPTLSCPVPVREPGSPAPRFLRPLPCPAAPSLPVPPTVSLSPLSRSLATCSPGLCAPHHHHPVSVPFPLGVCPSLSGSLYPLWGLSFPLSGLPLSTPPCPL